MRAGTHSLRTHVGVILASLAGMAASVSAQSVSNTITYQGEIMDAGAPVATADLRFRLYDASSGGVQIGGELSLNGATMSAEGRFTVDLDFGAAAFAGGERWLEIDVRTPAGVGTFRTLAPRQQVRAAPYSLTANKANTATDALSLNGQSGAFYQNASNLTNGTLAPARMHSSVPRLGNSQEFTGANTFSSPGNIFTGNGAAITSLNATSVSSGTLDDARLTTNVALLNRTVQTFTGRNIFATDAEFQALVGVGTPTPTSRLHVSGGAATDLIRAESTAAAGSIFAIRNTSAGGQEYLTVATGSASTEGAGKLVVRNAGNTLTTLQPNGYLGIGVTSPGQMLAVREGIVVDQGNTNNGIGPQVNPPWPGVTFGGTSSGEGIGSKKTAGGNQNGLDFYTNRLKRVSITSAGNVGIGTDAPSSSLEVAQGGTVRLRAATGTPNDAGDLQFLNADGTSRLGIHSGTTANPFLVIDMGANGSSEMVMDPTGNVGIGTTGPVEKLAVGGTVLVDANGANVGNGANAIRFSNFGPLTGIQSPRAGAGNVNGLDFFTGGPAARMSLTASGLLGVGTSTPGAVIHAIGNDNPYAMMADGNTSHGTELQVRNQEPNFGGHFVLRVSGADLPLPSGSMAVTSWQLNTAPNLLLMTDGSVGVGASTAPRALMEVKSNDKWSPAVGNGFGDFSIASGGHGLSFGLATSGGGAGTARIWTQGNKALALGPSATPEALWINTGGNIGLGTSAPADRLHIANGANLRLSADAATPNDAGDVIFASGGGGVRSRISAGTAAASALEFDAGGSGIDMVIANNGSVGVGTLTPSAKLEVSSADTEVRIRNTNDTGGGVVVNSFGALQLGLYNPTAGAWGAIPANTTRKLFGMNNNGVVGSLTNTGNSPTFRNILDDGNGRMALAGSVNSFGFAISVGTNASNGNGAFLSNGGIWTDISDRDKKENFEALDVQWVLDQVATLPISRWNYIGAPDVLHIGPMAQDFHSAFGVGESDRHLASLDSSGVALASIQALNQRLEAKEAELAAEREVNVRQQQLIEELMKRLEALEAAKN